MNLVINGFPRDLSVQTKHTTSSVSQSLNSGDEVYDDGFQSPAHPGKFSIRLLSRSLVDRVPRQECWLWTTFPIRRYLTNMPHGIVAFSRIDLSEIVLPQSWVS